MNIKIVFFFLSLMLIGVLYLLSASSRVVNLPLVIENGGQLKKTASYFQFSGEIYGGSISDYKGRYSEVVSFYLESLRAVESRTSADSNRFFFDGSDTASSINMLRETLKEGRSLWEYTKLHSIYEYNDRYFLLLKHKIKGEDFFPIRHAKLIRSNTGLTVDLNKKLSFIEQVIMNWMLYAQENQFNEHLGYIGVRALSKVKAAFFYTEATLSEGAKFFFPSGGEKGISSVRLFLSQLPEKNFAQIFESNRISKKSMSSIKAWMKNSDLGMEDSADSIIFGWPKSKFLSFGFYLDLGEGCGVLYYQDSRKMLGAPVMVCASDRQGKVIVNLYAHYIFNDLFSNGSFVSAIAESKKG